MMDDFMLSLRARFACKKFDPSASIDGGVFNNILESGRLSPSSFGLEPTRLVVVKSASVRNDIKPLCWNQHQIVDSSELVILKSLKSDMLPSSNYVRKQLSRRGWDNEYIEEYIESRYTPFIDSNGYMDNIGNWSSCQAYIMATTMVNYASYLGVDTCFIEGFDKKALEEYFGIDCFKEQISLILAFGYRAMEKGERHRLAIEEIVEYV